MKLTLTLNIGSQHAKQFGLDHTLEGETVDVKKDIAEVLLKRGWAVDATPAPEPVAAKPEHIKADPIKPELHAVPNLGMTAPPRPKNG